MNRKICIVILIVSCACAGNAYAEGLQTLIETGGSMAEIAKEQNAQTARFDQVKQAIDSGALKKGDDKDTLLSQYGEPVIANIDTATDREKWVYMPATSDFFKGVKVYLYFTGETLDEIVVKG